MKQEAYLRALSSIDILRIHYGKFATRKVWGKLRHPPRFRPDEITLSKPWPEAVRVIRSEEKGSDVNLGVQIVSDAFEDRYDVAAIITNDTDLEGAIRVVKERADKPVVLLSPVAQPHRILREASSSVKIIRRSHLAASQFPDEVTLADGLPVKRPITWVYADLQS